MTVDDFETLLQHPEALTAAAALAPTEKNFLQSFESLRRRWPDAVAKAAIETVILRGLAKEKFPQAAEMFFERTALEQATHHLVAAHRAKRFAAFKKVLDIGCGLGADSLAFANAGCEVIAVENEPLRAKLAKFNLAKHNVLVIHDDYGNLILNDIDAVYCDPARRDGSQRMLDPEQCRPAPSEVISRFPNKPVSFKLAPGLPRHFLDAMEGEVEYVSLHGELKECRVWRNWPDAAKIRATVLPAGESLSAEAVTFVRDLGEPQKYLYLPDAAVIRAQLEPDLAVKLQAKFLDGTQPFLTSDVLSATRFAAAYQFDALISGKPKRLAEALRERKVGRVTWRNFGSPREVEEVRQSVKLKGDEHRTVILTKLHDAAAALIVHAAD